MECKTQFKPGDKVRFRQNGEFGNMNKYMYANNVMLDREYEVIDITGGVARIISYGLYFDVPSVCIELVPEPQPKFANIKVGDWVELIYDNGCKYHCEVIQVGCSIVVIFDGSKTYFDVNGFELNKCENDNAFEITRILSPNEVIVDFGSGIKGTVRKLGKDAISVSDSDNLCVAVVALSTLIPETRAIVKPLVNAQEEE